MPSRSDNPMTTLTDALAAVAAEMREMENKGYAYAAIGGAIIKWADRIEQALATQQGEAVEHITEYRRLDAGTTEWSEWEVFTGHKNLGSIPPYTRFEYRTHPSPALSAEEADYLRQLEMHSQGDEQGSVVVMDKTMARGLANTICRLTSAAKPVEGADQRPFIAAEMYRLVDGMKASEDISEVAERLEKLAGHLAKQNNPIPAAVQVPTMPGNWPEDASHENGDYECRCVTCKQTFYGHKRRVVCKVCASPNAAVRVDERQWPKSCDALGIARCDHPNSCGCSRANAEAELLPVLRHYVTDAIANDRLGDHAEINGSVLARIDAALAHKESK